MTVQSQQSPESMPAVPTLNTTHMGLGALCRLVDALPKHWGRAAAGASPTQQLAEKQRLHAALLATLTASGVLSRLPLPSIR